MFFRDIFMVNVLEKANRENLNSENRRSIEKARKLRAKNSSSLAKKNAVG